MSIIFITLNGLIKLIWYFFSKLLPPAMKKVS